MTLRLQHIAKKIHAKEKVKNTTRHVLWFTNLVLLLASSLHTMREPLLSFTYLREVQDRVKNWLVEVTMTAQVCSLMRC